MDRLSSILPKVLKQRGLHEQISASSLVARAQRWIENALPGHAAALKVKKLQAGSLIIEAADPIALSECAERRGELLTHLQSLSEHVSDVRDVRLQRA